MAYKLNQSDHFVSVDGILADGVLANSEANMYLDTTSKDLKIKYKDDTGTVRTVLIGDSTAFATGQVLFGDTDGSITSDTNFFWDNTAKSLGLGGTADSSAIFQVNSTTKASRPAPVMDTVDRNNIPGPINGLMIYNTDTEAFEYYDGTNWVSFGSEATLLIADTATGPWVAAQNISLRVGFISDTQISLSIEGALDTATVNSAILVTTALPVAFRPTVDKRVFINVIDNGSSMVGNVFISSAGLITIEGAGGTQFTGSGSTGYTGSTIVYDVAI
jgi:hypothetical protein